MTQLGEITTDEWEEVGMRLIRCKRDIGIVLNLTSGRIPPDNIDEMISITKKINTLRCHLETILYQRTGCKNSDIFFPGACEP
jgi:hypothetical protein